MRDKLGPGEKGRVKQCRPVPHLRGNPIDEAVPGRRMARQGTGDRALVQCASWMSLSGESRTRPRGFKAAVLFGRLDHVGASHLAPLKLPPM